MIILFLLSVSVFMCEELLACCACARGELVPGDWQPNAPSLPWPRDAGPGVLAPEGHLSLPEPPPSLFQLYNSLCEGESAVQ